MIPKCRKHIYKDKHIYAVDSVQIKVIDAMTRNATIQVKVKLELIHTEEPLTEIYKFLDYISCFI